MTRKGSLERGEGNEEEEMGRGREGAGGEEAQTRRRWGGEEEEDDGPGSSQKREDETPQRFERATAYALSYFYVTALAMRMYLYGYV